MTFFQIQNSLLYYHCTRHGESCYLIVVPCTKVDTIMYLAHSHPLGGHQGAQNMLQLIPLAWNGSGGVELLSVVFTMPAHLFAHPRDHTANSTANH